MQIQNSRMNAHPIRVSTALVMLGTLSACGVDHDLPRGPMTSETREVGDFDSIVVRGSAQLQITVGEPASLSIEGNEEAVKALKAEVHGDTLRIRTSGKQWMFPGGNSRLIVKVTMPKLEELKLEGGNDVRVAGFNGGDTTIEIEGAANLKANGHVDELVVSMEGAGHADLRDLIAGDAKVTVDGVGSVYVNSTESLDATMNGVGAILYSGTPHEVNTSMRGLGTISKDRERKASDDQDWNEDPNPDANPEVEPEVERDDRKKIDLSKIEPEYEV